MTQRQERVRRENPRSNQWQRDPNTRRASHEDLYFYAQQEILHHSAIAASNALSDRAWDDKMIREAKENNANGNEELRERWLADRQSEINICDLWDIRHHPSPPQRIIDFLDFDQ